MAHGLPTQRPAMLTPALEEELVRLGSAKRMQEHLVTAGHTKIGPRLAIVNAVLAQMAAASADAGATRNLSKIAVSTAGGAAAEPTCRYRVVHRPFVYVRPTASTSAAYIGLKWPGDVVKASEGADGWLELVGEDGFVLRDGTILGFGELLRPLPDAPSTDGASWPIIVLATDGLCNRLRVALSFALVARREGRPLTVVWPLCKECAHGRFGDAFAPIDGVTFVDDAPAGVRPQFPPNFHDFHGAIRGTADEDECYRLLRLRPELAATVNATVRQSGPNFASVHIRRTDHWGSRVTDGDFEAFIEAQAPHNNVYVATDSRDTQSGRSEVAVALIGCSSPATQAHYVRRFGERVRVHATIDSDGSQLRQTPLAGAAADLFCAAAADGPFKGCPTSSFSDTILRLRRVQGQCHAADDHTVTDAQAQFAVTLGTPGGHLQHSQHGMARATYTS
eukprot:7382760-Prymnesium_polylepis.1